MIRKKWSFLFLLACSYSTNFAVKTNKIPPLQEKKSKTPTIIKQFSCKICGNSFKKKGSLKEHIETHFKTTYCHICPNYGRAKYTTLNHIKTKHELDTEEARKCMIINEKEIKNFLATLHQHNIFLKNENPQLKTLSSKARKKSPAPSPEIDLPKDTEEQKPNDIHAIDDIADFDVDALFI